MSKRRRNRAKSSEDEYSDSDAETPPPPKRRKRSEFTLTWKDACVRVLTERNEVMSIQDIAKEIVSAGFREATKTPHLTVSNIINTNINEEDEVRFFREGPGRYGLVEWGGVHQPAGPGSGRGRGRDKKKRKRKKPKTDSDDEGVVGDKEDTFEVNVEEVDSDNILFTKRRRPRVSYRALNGDEEDDDDD